MVWVKPFVQGASPAGRGGCASAVVGDMCLFIGGADRSPRAFNDVWVLKLGSDGGPWRWVKKTTTVGDGVRLPERMGATATAVGRKVYVFGGQEPTRGVCFNDVVVLDCNTWTWSRLEVAGASPPPRNSHTACVTNNGRLLVVYGGASQEHGPLGDVHVLDLQEGAERWTYPRVGGQSPEPREMHAACMLPAIDHDNNGTTGNITTPTTSASGDGDEAGDGAGAAAGAAAGAGAVAGAGAGAGAAGDEDSAGWGDHEMLVVGGRGRGGVLSDVVVLDTREMAWVRRGDVGQGLTLVHFSA